VRNQPKWRTKLADSSTIDPWVSSSDRTGEEEVTHPIGHDRAKAVVTSPPLKRMVSPNQYHYGVPLPK
jgi:hypothetical protein